MELILATAVSFFIVQTECKPNIPYVVSERLRRDEIVTVLNRHIKALPGCQHFVFQVTNRPKNLD